MVGEEEIGEQAAISELACIPARVDFRTLLPPVRDQGERGTCLAFAVTAAHELARRGTPGVIEDLSEEALHWRSKQLDGDTEPGTAFSSAADAIKQWGQPAEEFWPYDGSRNDAGSGYYPPAGVLDPAHCHRATLQQVVLTVDEIKRQLAAGRAVVLGMLLSRGCYLPAGGLIPMPDPDEALGEGHAVLIVGYDDHLASGTGCLILRNSWGEEWGDAGYGYLPYAYLGRGGISAWIIDPTPGPESWDHARGGVERATERGRTLERQTPASPERYWALIGDRQFRGPPQDRPFGRPAEVG